MATKTKTPQFDKEADLCKAFIDDVRKQEKGWQAYPETGGFDILLAHATGMQIGIEAKLTLNAKVVAQALPEWHWSETGPDFRAVLVPAGGNLDLMKVCEHVGVRIMRQRHPDEKRWYSHLDLPSPDVLCHQWEERRWNFWCPTWRLKLPDYVPDVTAGDKAPLKLTTWKINAIKVQVILEERPVQRADIKALGLSPSRWFDRCSGFLEPTNNGYVASKIMPDFRQQHPINYEQIKADKAKWLPDVSRGRLI